MMIAVRKNICQKFYLVILYIIFIVVNSSTALSQKGGISELNNTMTTFNKLLLSANIKQAHNLISLEEKKALATNRNTLPQVYYLYSKYYFFVENFDEAKNYAEKSLKAGNRSASKVQKAYGFYAMANHYYQVNMLALSFNYLSKSLGEIDPEKNPDLAYHIYYRLYSIHTNWNDAKETNLYAQKAVEYALKAEDYDALSNGYSAKVSAMKNMFEQNKRTVYKDSILYYLVKSAQFDYKFPGRVSIRTSTIANINLADFYFQKFYAKEISYEIAKDSMMKYLEKVERISSTIDQNFELRASSLGMKAQLALANNDVALAEQYLLTAYNNLKTEKSRPAFYTLYNVTIGLHKLYEEKQDYKNAYAFLGINQVYKDSIFNEDKIYEVHALKAKYENDKIKEEIKFLETESKQQKIQNYLVIIVSILSISTLIFFVKNYRQKLKLQKSKSVILEKQNTEAQAQVNLEKEKQARLSAERKILKLENEKMQKEVMVSGLHLDRKNELLEDIRKELANSATNADLQKSLKQDKRIEKSLNETVKEFEEINPVFFQKLKVRSSDTLTALDLKYCAYFHLELSTKEISQVFNVEPKSIRMKKYRIKQKLNLDKDESLESYLKTLEKQ